MVEIAYTAYLEGSLQLTAAGEWIHNGVPFQNSSVIALFNRSVVWDPHDARYYVRIGKQQATFRCDDTAFFATALEQTRSPWRIVFSDGREEELLSARLSQGSAHQLYYKRSFDGQYARCSRGVHQQLVEHALDESTLRIDGVPARIPLRGT